MLILTISSDVSCVAVPSSPSVVVVVAVDVAAAAAAVAVLIGVTDLLESVPARMPTLAICPNAEEAVVVVDVEAFLTCPGWMVL